MNEQPRPIPPKYRHLLPPGSTRCDWCHKTVAWKDAQMVIDNECLCPACYREYVALGLPT